MGLLIPTTLTDHFVTRGGGSNSPACLIWLPRNRSQFLHGAGPGSRSFIQSSSITIRSAHAEGVIPTTRERAACDTQATRRDQREIRSAPRARKLAGIGIELDISRGVWNCPN
jgi:hypothetical protein